MYIFCTLHTPHCNDDLYKINEQRSHMINSSKRMPWLCKFTIFKILSWTVFEIQASMHSQSAQIWQNFLPVLYQPSKMVHDMIFKTVILHSQGIHLLELTIRILCSFILFRSSLQWSVCSHYCNIFLSSEERYKRSLYD